MKYRIRIISLLFCILVLGLTGCGRYAVPESSAALSNQDAEGEVTEENKYANVLSMEQAPVINYIVPSSTPNILVTLQGYSGDGSKEAFVKGEELPSDFQVVSADGGQIIYTGTIEDIEEVEEQNISVGYIDFSDLETEGEYYIQCDVIGRSETFAIKTDCHVDLLNEVYGAIVELAQANALSVPDAVMVMQAYEWYPNVFPDSDMDGVADILPVMQKWVSYMEENGVEQEQEAMYAVFLAKFSYQYRKIDYKYATDCMQRASTVYGKVQESRTVGADCFYALTELYRVTDHQKYRNQILEYKSYFADNSNYYEEREYIYGGLTYSMTRRTVDKGLCELLVNHVLAQGEEIAGSYEELLHPVLGSADSEEIMKRAMELSCANYVLNNYQYTNIIKEFLNYLMGRNTDSKDFYGEGTRQAEYLLLLAQLVATAEELETSE